MAAVLKTVGRQRPGGSNPSASAERNAADRRMRSAVFGFRRQPSSLGCRWKPKTAGWTSGPTGCIPCSAGPLAQGCRRASARRNPSGMFKDETRDVGDPRGQPENRVASHKPFYGVLWHPDQLCATIWARGSFEYAIQHAQRPMISLCEFRVKQTVSISVCKTRRNPSGFGFGIPSLYTASESWCEPSDFAISP